MEHITTTQLDQAEQKIIERLATAMTNPQLGGRSADYVSALRYATLVVQTEIGFARSDAR